MGEKEEAVVREIRNDAFDERDGSLRWRLETVERFWKRGSNVLHQKWESPAEGTLLKDTCC